MTRPKQTKTNNILQSYKDHYNTRLLVTNCFYYYHLQINYLMLLTLNTQQIVEKYFSSIVEIPNLSSLLVLSLQANCGWLTVDQYFLFQAIILIPKIYCSFSFNSLHNSQSVNFSLSFIKYQYSIMIRLRKKTTISNYMT